MSEASAKATLKEYQLQVLRWNRQINLISRQNPEARLRSLVGQCWNCLDALLDDEEPIPQDPAGLLYYDLGSGAGLPGVVWHTLLAARGYAPRSCLVEPREKRAWFLRRMAALPGMPPFTVFLGRWGASAATNVLPEGGEAAPGAVLISLKALKLTDAEVLDGFAVAQESAEMPLAAGLPLRIARFYPGGQALDRALATDLAIPAAGTLAAAGKLSLEATGSRVLSPANAPTVSLVVSSYRLATPA